MSLYFRHQYAETFSTKDPQWPHWHGTLLVNFHYLYYISISLVTTSVLQQPDYRCPFSSHFVEPQCFSSTSIPLSLQTQSLWYSNYMQDLLILPHIQIPGSSNHWSGCDSSSPYPQIISPFSSCKSDSYLHPPNYRNHFLPGNPQPEGHNHQKKDQSPDKDKIR